MLNIRRPEGVEVSGAGPYLLMAEQGQTPFWRFSFSARKEKAPSSHKIFTEPVRSWIGYVCIHKRFVWRICSCTEF